MSNHSINALAENIFIDKIKNNNISSDNIYKCWKSSREEAKKLLFINKISNDIYNFIMYCMNIIISLIFIYILFYIYCIIYLICDK